MWPAHIPNFLLRRLHPAVYLSHRFIMTQSWTAQHAHVAARTQVGQTVWSEFIFFLLLIHVILGFYFLAVKFLMNFIAFRSEDSPNLQAAIDGPGKWTGQPLVQCTSHMCPIRIHWHVKLNYKEYWRVKITITNFNFRMNYTQWNLVAQHPNFDNITQLFSFNYKPLTPYGGGISK